MVNRFLKRNKSQADLVINAKQIKNNYDIFKVTLLKNKLVCTGKVKSELGNYYQIEIIECIKGKASVKILEPKITPKPEIHMYQDGTLCLYHYLEKGVNSNLSIAYDLIPWTCEWILFYELYKKTGTWFGKESVHFNSNKKRK